MDIPQARVEEVRPDGVRVKFETGRYGFLDVDLIKPVSEEGTTGILVYSKSLGVEYRIPTASLDLQFDNLLSVLL